MPMSRMMRLKTVAKTGRRMQSSESDIGSAFDGGGRRRHDLDIGTVAQTRLARDHDLLADFDALEDLDETVFAPSGQNLGLLGLAIVSLEDEEIVAARYEGAFRDRDGRAWQALDGDAGEKAWPQFAVVDWRASP